MLLEKEREKIVLFGNKLISSGLTTGTGGNLSILNREKGLAAISPTGIEYSEIKPEDVVVLDMDANIVDSKKKPSSEYGFHLALYKKRLDICSVIHTHSAYATTMACLQWEIPAVHYLVGFSGHKVPVAPYAEFGTRELADSITMTIKDYNAVLMANHGMAAVGESIARAFAVAEEIEFVARIYYQTKSVGLPPLISKHEMDKVLERFKTYGQK
ncbi:Aldolase, Class II [Desulfonema limicola]|uniref:Aldolase, Class II n=1 Tax=Desulfonema limicola TaxID=45656 RepID=A0A975BAF7_9BACT|nr:L-fuculose-phosphate aldolase [Desulfonema limicola]QTA81788.1 Aldolase, Class II [Desulfonema limicola]